MQLVRVHAEGQLYAGRLGKQLFKIRRTSSVLSLSLKPDDALAFEGRGNAYAGKGDYDRAIQDLTNALRLEQHDNEIRAELEQVKKAKAGR